MNKMIVAHESPLALLDKSLSYNDYDYCLVHLLPEYPQYLDFFRRSKALGRHTLLDNSLFELGEAFEASKFAYWIQELLPHEYVVPDVFSDSAKTIESFKSWDINYKDMPGRKIGVVQGRTYQEMIDCYSFMAVHADKIAINFISSYFGARGHSRENNATPWHILMDGRQQFIRDLMQDGFWAYHKPHHLLGCTLPQEFQAYEGIFNIESIDTSNPVVAGMHNIKYNDHGLDDKLSAKLADMLEAPVSDEHWDCISFNINKFREINKIHKG